jgi:nucleoside-diphosphate-sugar epimerase
MVSTHTRMFFFVAVVITLGVIGILCQHTRLFLNATAKPSTLHLQECPTPARAAQAMKSAKVKAQGLKALVTGAAGFIGSPVARDCAELGFDTVALDDMSGGFERNVPDGVRLIVGDLKDAAFVAELFEKEKFDVVFHLAAYAAEGLSHFIRNYNYQNNLIASTNIITQAVRVGGVQRIVFTSSIAVYGAGRTPMTEDLGPAPEDPYGAAPTCKPDS